MKSPIRFADRSKITTSAPSALSPMNTNESAKQRETQEKARRAAEAARADGVAKSLPLHPLSRTASTTAVANSSLAGRNISARGDVPLGPFGILIDRPTARQDYILQENVMEKKARALGLRREFFVYLQDARARAKAEHPACTRQARSHIADAYTWDKFCEYNSFLQISAKCLQFL